MKHSLSTKRWPKALAGGLVSLCLVLFASFAFADSSLSNLSVFSAWMDPAVNANVTIQEDLVVLDSMVGTLATVYTEQQPTQSLNGKKFKATIDPENSLAVFICNATTTKDFNSNDLVFVGFSVMPIGPENEEKARQAVYERVYTQNDLRNGKFLLMHANRAVVEDGEDMPQGTYLIIFGIQEGDVNFDALATNLEGAEKNQPDSIVAGVLLLAKDSTYGEHEPDEEPEPEPSITHPKLKPRANQIPGVKIKKLEAKENPGCKIGNFTAIEESIVNYEAELELQNNTVTPVASFYYIYTPENEILLSALPLQSYSADANKTFTYVAHHGENNQNGYWWMETADKQPIRNASTILEKGKSYNVCFTVQNNLCYDQKKGAEDIEIRGNVVLGVAQKAMTCFPDSIDGVVPTVTGITTNPTYTLNATEKDRFQSILDAYEIRTNCFSFNATVNATGAIMVFSANTTNIAADNANEIEIVKLYNDGTHLIYPQANYLESVNSTSANKDGMWWITDTATNMVLAKNATVVWGKTYKVSFTIKDNGKYDADNSTTKVEDPAFFGTKSKSKPLGGDSSSSSSCSLNPGATLGLEWLLLAAPALPWMRRRMKK